MRSGLRIDTARVAGRSALGSSLSESRRSHLLGVADSARGYMSLEDMLSALLERICSSLEVNTAAMERAVTAIMQRILLPDALPEIPGMRLSAKYLPAGAGTRIGGDWYDVVPLANRRVAFVIGDVVGRGALAAAVMAEIRTALRAYMAQGHKLTEVISMLNELLIAMGRNRAATLSILELDPEAKELEAVSAGHLPPLLIERNGDTRLLEQTHGLPVGVRTGREYQACRYPFPTGSRLVLYTDGLIGRRDESINEGFRRLTVAARAAAQGTDSSFAERVYRALVNETPLEDDVALLAIEAVPLEDTLELTLPARPNILGGLRGALGSWLRAAGANENELFDITLSASEAASNAIEHAYGAREAGFTVRCEHDGRDVTVTVRDMGRWRTGCPLGGGRGLEIMRSLVDNVTVKSDERGTVVTMIKRLSHLA